MNDRISQIELACWSAGETPEEDTFSTDLFAKLIIKECISVIETRRVLWGDKCDIAKEECKVLSYLLKEHFGGELTSDVTNSFQKWYGNRIQVNSAILDHMTDVVDINITPIKPLEHIEINVKIDNTPPKGTHDYV